MRAVIPPMKEATMTFTKLSDEFLKYRAAKGGAVRTGENYQLAFNQFKTFLANHDMKDDVRNFTAENVEMFAGELTAGGMKGSSVGTKLAALSALGTYGTKPNVKVFEHNPADKRVERPKCVRPTEKYLYREELEAMLRVECAPNERLALMLLLDTNCRASELSSARVKDLGVNGDVVTIAIVLKGGQPDTVDLSPEVGQALLESLKFREARPEDPIIVNQANLPYTRQSLSSVVDRMAKRAGITRILVRAHVFARHSPASALGQDGASEFEIAALLRHSDTSTARRYVHGVSGAAARERVRGLLRG